MNKIFKTFTVYHYPLFQIICNRKLKHLYFENSDETKFKEIFEIFKDCEDITRGMVGNLFNCYIPMDNNNQKMIIDLLVEYLRENGINKIELDHTSPLNLYIDDDDDLIYDIKCENEKYMIYMEKKNNQPKK